MAELSKEDSQLTYRAADDVYDGEDWVYPYDLPETYMTVWAVSNAEGIIGNGGIHGFFGSDWIENPPYSFFIEAYRRIGADEVADCLVRAVDQFPFPDPELHEEKRQDYMEATRSKKDKYDSVIDKLGSQINELADETIIKLAGYIRQHLDDFPKAKKYLEGG